MLHIYNSNQIFSTSRSDMAIDELRYNSVYRMFWKSPRAGRAHLAHPVADAGQAEHGAAAAGAPHGQPALQ